jgi:hypothetical protein
VPAGHLSLHQRPAPQPTAAQPAALPQQPVQTNNQPPPRLELDLLTRPGSPGTKLLRRGRCTTPAGYSPRPTQPPPHRGNATPSLGETTTSPVRATSNSIRLGGRSVTQQLEGVLDAVRTVNGASLRPSRASVISVQGAHALQASLRGRGRRFAHAWRVSVAVKPGP